MNPQLTICRCVFLLCGMTALLFPQVPDRLSEAATISLLTISPGTELYTTFGHTAFRVVDPANDVDRIYNYGTFEFDEPGFYLKFCQGKLDYKLSAYRYEWAEQVYVEEERAIIQQTLNLTPGLRDYLFEFLEWNHLPQHRYYRYDFFFDNCATRPRDVFVRVFGEDVQLYLNEQRHLTFRQYIDRYLTALPFSDYGIDLALGARTDRVATAWEAMFLPDYLYEGVAGGKIRIDGQWQPLVARTDTLHYPERAQHPPTALPWAHILMAGVLLLTAFLTIREIRHTGGNHPKLRWIDYLLFGYAGLVGVIIFLLWFATEHTTTADNWNLLWAWPLHLPVLILFPPLRKNDWLKGYLLAYGAFLLMTLAGWAFWPQDLHEANIPLLLALIIRCGWQAIPALYEANSS